MGLLYNVEPHTINYHLKKIFSDSELEEQSVIRKFRITASDGKTYNTNHYNLKAIIAVGNKVDSPRAVQFRKWANGIIEEFTIKGFTMDDERLKNFGTVLTKDYFEEQLERIREIRLSERRFYQKITDIYATSIDYDPKAQTTRLFFARVQNQLHWAIHGETAAEVIYHTSISLTLHLGEGLRPIHLHLNVSFCERAPNGQFKASVHGFKEVKSWINSYYTPNINLPVTSRKQWKNWYRAF